MKKAVIFDLDGVLIDSQPFHFEADIIVLGKVGVRATMADVQKYAGMANPDRWPNYKRDFNLDTSAEELIAIHIKTIDEYLDANELKPIRGVVELLELLRGNGIPMTIASSSSQSFIRKVLGKMGIIEYFPLIVSGEDVSRSKPEPDIFLMAAEKLGRTPEECVILEDSTNGVTAAYRAGIYCVGYINESSGAQDLSLASVVIDDYSKINRDLHWLQ